MSDIYKKSMAALDKVVPAKLQPLWMHPAGPKTIFFWAPLFKWGLVIAGLADLSRPAETISVGQASALAATGLICVNLFVATTQCFQVFRAIRHNKNLEQTNTA